MSLGGSLQYSQPFQVQQVDSFIDSLGNQVECANTVYMQIYKPESLIWENCILPR